MEKNIEKNRGMSLSTEEKRYYRLASERAFVKACRKVMESAVRRGETLTREMIITRAMEEPTGGYCVSVQAAYETVRRLPEEAETAPAGEKMQRASRRKWHDLAQAVRRRREARPGMTLARAVADVINFENAPRHYFSRRKAREIFRQHFATVYQPREDSLKQP